jgi:hypothetical protein
MVFRKERDRLKEIDSELSRIKKDLLLIDRSLKSLNKAGAITLDEPGPEAKPSKEKAKGKAKAEAPPKKKAGGPKPKARKKAR